MESTNSSEVQTLVEHFFRYESGKLVAVLTRLLGQHNLALVEDIVQDTLIEAISGWTYNGIPNNPAGWLYTVAKNKSLNKIKRNDRLKHYISEQAHLSEDINSVVMDVDVLFKEESIADDQLRMMFMCCHPAISRDSQIALTLKTLCGFSISEIGSAFLLSNESINKRLVRARKSIRTHQVPFEVPTPQEMDTRVETVLEVIYLVFNEGYNASTGDQLIKRTLCEEAIRLGKMVVENQHITNKPIVYALISLMQLNSSRFDSRQDLLGNILTLEMQDRQLWDYKIMEQGFLNLEKATHTEFLSKYHLMAGISSYYCSAKAYESIDWQSILTLYDKLLTINRSPIVILNRAVVLSKIGRHQKALDELEIISSEKTIKSYHLYYATKSDIQQQLNEKQKAKENLLKAIDLAPLKVEKRFLENRLANF